MLKTIYKYSFGSSSEYYENSKGQRHGPFTSFYPNGQKNYEGSYILDRWVGVWKRYNSDGRRRWIDTNKNDRRNGVKIKF